MTNLEKLLIRHEGIKLKPYSDTAGKLTIGIGRNLTDDGITKDEAYLLMHNDIVTCNTELSKFYWFKNLDSVRQDVLIDMAFNLGIPKLLGFRNMIEALKEKDYKKASEAMLASIWTAEVHTRAFDLSQMMLTGEYPYEP